MNQFTNNLEFARHLEERIEVFGEEIIAFCKTLNQDAISRPIISQLVRSSTSIGANYMEANSACSLKDFKNKIYICKKESQETKHWLRMITQYFPEKIYEINSLKNECQEFILIFQTATSTLQKDDSQKNITITD